MFPCLCYLLPPCRMLRNLPHSTSKMAQQTAAVIGAGTCGLSTLKTLREDGFRVTGFERRERVGGLWAYTDDPSMTSALKTTRALISKHTCGMTDFSMPDKYPSHLSTDQFQEYIESYAKHFDLLQDITFNATVTRTVRNEDDTRRRLEILISGEERIEEFDKVVFCHGYQTKPSMPQFEGQEFFTG
ncbi:hypothetical protein HBH56_164240 [Parastagonospora nodorum]|uniref:Flavin-containing monooxygenase n=1 Tax=Phaeosphaeria nodorum (strain SN15 / ATCC MYA-4574 / FGSC 10173) TaxID=321614 RepID=A0A7U2NQA8_PHANO|nr:hypothetical protein HBH56_164240 [Parastagonospora nodorum]QRD06555.1 hypothetical protein JI435_119230 [Parastagonospora nodorum SN15]KAH3932141.1 hypothetical protein HBH54_085000 [Parastagonospora nodorum]KAH4095439.1 hypothetical protein HBH46_169350 [Parastagonospora nodorum]KAH4141449.1 hypothetical protein HBH45_073020 [Parastagonospora nodorum]